MDFFKSMMEKISAQQFALFKESLQDKMDRKFYLSVLLGTFLGGQYFPMTQEQYDESFKTVDDAKFNSYCHKTIDSISLCGDEIDFFHKIVDSKSKIFVVKYLEIYHSINGLPKCQLGPNILKCLEASRSIEIV